MTSKPRYENPEVAYNTGYNDGQREERDALLEALAAFEIETLMAEVPSGMRSIPWCMGRLKKLRDALERGAHRSGEPDHG